MLQRVLFRLATAVLLLAFCSCGDDGEPLPGYAEPCESAAGALLGCAPARAGNGHGLATEATACRRLVTCGVLAAERMRNSGADHYLDYAWCAQRLQTPGAQNDPCGGRRYSLQEVQTVVDCIHATPCVSLGADFSAKNSGNAPADSYQCASGETRRTASVCDHGLLSY